MSRLFIFVFFVFGFLFDGFKNELYFYIFSIFLLIYFYIANLKISVSSAILLPFCAFFSIFNLYSIDNEYFLFYKVFISILFYFYFSNIKEEKYNFLNFFLKFYVYYVFLLILVFYYSSFLNIDWYFIGKNNNYIAFFTTGAFLIKYIEWKSKRNYLDLVFCLFFLVFLLYINSRSSYVSIFISLIFLSKDKIRFFLYSICMFLFLFLILPHDFLIYILKLNDPNSYMRPYIWFSAIKGFLKNPLFGNGIDFKYIFEMYKFPYYDGVNYYNHSTIHSHNEFLNILAEYGVLYFLIYISIIIEAFRFKNIYIKIMILNFTIFSFFDIVLKVPFLNLFYFSILGLGMERNNGKFLNFRKIFIISVLFLIFSFNGFYLKETGHIKYNETIEIITSPHRKAALSRYFLSFYPYDPFLYYNLALYYHNIERYDLAEIFLKKLITIEPNFNQALLMYSDLMIKAAKYNEAKKYLYMIKPYLCDTVYCYKTSYFDKNIYLSFKKLLDNLNKEVKD